MHTYTCVRMDGWMWMDMDGWIWMDGWMCHINDIHLLITSIIAIFQSLRPGKVYIGH